MVLADWLLIGVILVGVGGMALLDLIWGELRRLRKHADVLHATGRGLAASFHNDLQGTHNATNKMRQLLEDLVQLARGKQ